MNELDTPTGQYNLAELKRIAGGIHRRIRSPAFDVDDLYHDLIMYLLEGKTMGEACIEIKHKYHKWNKGVSIFTIPQEFVSSNEREENVRILSDHDHAVIHTRFFSLLDRLDPQERNLMTHVMLGFSIKEIASILKETENHIGVMKHRIIRKMRG
jgi:DNA-binding CsgD family transcriptional regulator